MDKEAFYVSVVFAGLSKTRTPGSDGPGVRYERMYESIRSASAYCFCAAPEVAAAGLVSLVVLACLACFFAGFLEFFAAGALLCVAGDVCPS